MQSGFAAILFRPDEVTDRALSHGFAVALAGWDVPDPYLEIADLPELPGWAAAFYRAIGRAKSSHDAITKEEEFDHAAELFEDELPPGLCVRDAAAERGSPEARVFAIAHSEEFIYDAAWRFAPDDFSHHFVREGEEGIEFGIETLDSDEVSPLDLTLADSSDAAIDDAIRPHRGSTFLSSELRRPVLAVLMKALFSTDRRLEIRLIDPTPTSIAEEAARLNQVLHRVDGRGAFGLPASLPEAPPSYAAFLRTYDFEDPTDPSDLYRELAIGKIEGTLHFLRGSELERIFADPDWIRALGQRFFPVATLSRSALGARSSQHTLVCLGADQDALWLVAPNSSAKLAGPTFGELLRYLSLGWKNRTEVEEDLIGALMLRARLRTTS